MLIGGEDGAFENFHEFITDGDPTAGSALSKAAFNEVTLNQNSENYSLKAIPEMIFCGK